MDKKSIFGITAAMMYGFAGMWISGYCIGKVHAHDKAVKQELKREAEQIKMAKNLCGYTVENINVVVKEV